MPCDLPKPSDRLRKQTLPPVWRLALRVLSCLLIVAGGSLASAVTSSPATANDQVAGLAAPGACAEPREAIAGAGESSFSVVGPVAALLSPVDVGAGPGPPPRLGPPVSTRLARPGPCDGPDSACLRQPTTGPTTTGGGNRPIVPGPPPGG